jgi:hypothetical protein
MIHTIHLICKDGLHLTCLPDGRFTTGVWLVGPAAAKQAQRVALHRSRAEPSFLQGVRLRSVAGEVEGKRRFTFEVQADGAPVTWPAGGGAGEKAYSRG